MIKSKNERNNILMDEHFENYNNKLNDIRIGNMELIRLKEDWYDVSGTSYDTMKIKGSILYDIADQLNYIQEKEKELTKNIQSKNELRKIHEDEIGRLEDNKKRTILKLFYLDKCTIKQIAFCLKISEAHTKRLKRDAVDEFIEKVEDK